MPSVDKETTAVLVAAKRTPMGRYKGALRNLRADDLLANTLKHTLASVPNLPAELLDDVIIGCSNQAGEDSRNVARQASLLAGLPASLPGITVNRLCGSGLSAIIQGWQGIASGQGQAYLVGAVEQMSRSPQVLFEGETHDSGFGWRFTNPLFKGLGYYSQHLEAAEKLASRLGINRVLGDSYTLASHQKAAKAYEQSKFQAELLPLPELAEDEGVRPGLTLERLARLKPLAGPKGGITAASACPFSDGACAMVLTSKALAKQYALPVFAQLVSTSTVACHPEESALAPVEAITKALNEAELNLERLAAIELHEPFAVSALAVCELLGLNWQDERLNAWGGALALGAPVAMVSSRLVVTLAHRLNAMASGAYGLAALSIGMGQGMALVLKN